MKKFVIVIDAQNDFMRSDGALYVLGAENIIHNINLYLYNIAKNQDDYEGVLFTMDTHDPKTYKDSEVAKQFPPHCYLGTAGWGFAINSGIISSKIYLQAIKNKFNMWEENVIYIDSDDGEWHREEYFEELKSKGITHIEFVGVAADYCVNYAVMGALQRGFTCSVVRNCTIGIHKQIDEVALDINNTNLTAV